MTTKRKTEETKTKGKGKEKQNQKIKLTAIILSAAIYSHHMETLMPGSFQNNVNKIYRKNRLKTVTFPGTIYNIQGINEIYTDILQSQLEKEIEAKEEKATDLEESEMEAEVFTKRQRKDAASPTGKGDNKKKQKI